MTDHVTSTGRTFSTSIIQREVIHAQGHRGSNQNSAVLRSDMAPSCHPAAGLRRPGTRVTGWSDAQAAPDRRPVPAPPRKENPCPARTSPVRRPPPARPSSPSTATTSPSTSTTGPETFSTTSTIHFRCTRPGAETFLDFVGGTVEAHHPQRGRPRPGRALRRQPRAPARAGRRERRRRRRHRPLHQHRRGPAPLRRPGRRRGLPLQPVRGAGQPADVPRLRAARPQGPLHLHGDRAGPLAGRVQLPHPAARAGRRRRARRGASPRPGRSRATSPRWSPGPTTSCATPSAAGAARCRSASSAAGR